MLRFIYIYFLFGYSIIIYTILARYVFNTHIQNILCAQYIHIPYSHSWRHTSADFYNKTSIKRLLRLFKTGEIERERAFDTEQIRNQLISYVNQSHQNTRISRRLFATLLYLSERYARCFFKILNICLIP